MLTNVVNLLREHLASFSILPGQVKTISVRLDQAVTLLVSIVARRAATESQVAKIDVRTQRLTPAHARTIQELVDRMVRETKPLPVPLSFVIIYDRLKHRFRAGSYKEVADERCDEMIAYLRDELRRAVRHQSRSGYSKVAGSAHIEEG